jgi:hypothetical protein
MSNSAAEQKFYLDKREGRLPPDAVFRAPHFTGFGISRKKGRGFFETRLREEANKMASLTPEEKDEVYEIAIAIAYATPAHPNPTEKGIFNINSADKNRGLSVSEVMRRARAVFNSRLEQRLNETSTNTKKRKSER